MSEEKLTPAMKQYYAMKTAYADALLFFRMGDFYEMFDEDAKVAGKELGLTVTSRNKNSATPTPLAGIPYHACERYLAELTKKGYKVAIAEQVSDPSLPGIVERKIVRVVTPSTTLQEEVLEKGKANYLCALVENSNTFFCAYVDLSTGESVSALCTSIPQLRTLLFGLSPKEILLDQDMFSLEEIKSVLTELSLTTFYSTALREPPEVSLQKQYGPHTHLLKEETSLQKAMALTLEYLHRTQLTTLSHLRPFRKELSSGIVHIDESTIRNLELLFTQREGKKEGSLWGVLDKTVTGSGGRKLHGEIIRPLTDKEEILRRQNLVGFFLVKSQLRQDLRSHLKNMYDIERLLAKINLDRANARDLLALQTCLYEIQHIVSLFTDTIPEELRSIIHELQDDAVSILFTLIDASIAEEPPITLQEGGLIKTGYNPAIDELKMLKSDGTQWLLQYQQEEQQKTGINTLKVKFNNVFGYFIEVPKSQAAKVPEYYIRRQTMVGAERFTTPELKNKEDSILHAAERLAQMEYACFQEIRATVSSHTPVLQKIAHCLSELDVRSALAEVAAQYRYTKPSFHESKNLHIQEGRHPVVEAGLLHTRDGFIPNDTQFLEKKEELLLITGPNMAGKSTYLRQIALISLMAQMGSFVPASSAKLPIVDAIFTRVGASDNVSKGQSTFMVEMQETSYILNQATEKSLVILDEVGRGTSTYDGLSIAWAIVEYIHQTIRAKTLFATHYHELIEMVEKLPRGKNYSVAVQETSTGVVFLRKIIPGGASESYGIEVAKLAGLPVAVIERAQKVLDKLEAHHEHPPKKILPPQTQLSFFDAIPAQEISPVLTEIQNFQIDTASPLACMQQILLWQEILKKSK